MAKKVRNTGAAEVTALYTYGYKIKPNEVMWVRDEDATSAQASGMFAVVADATTHQYDFREGVPRDGDMLDEADQAALNQMLRRQAFPAPVSGAGSSVGLSGVAYDGNGRVTAYTLNGVSYTVAGWGTSSVTIAGSNGSVQTISLDAQGRFVGVE